MGTMTGQNFIDELSYILGNRTDLADAPGIARRLRWVNFAYQHLTNPKVHMFPELGEVYDITLVAADNDYTLASATVTNVVRGVRDVTYYDAAAVTATATKCDLSPRDIDWFNARTIPSGGNPTIYAWDFVGPQLLIYPVPSATEAGNIVRVTYFAAPANLTVATTTVLEDLYWDGVLLNGAKWIAEWELGYRELSIASRQVYAEMINEPADGFDLQADDRNFVSEFKHDSYMPTG